MALLQSGKIYNIKVDFHKALNETPEKFLNAFINEYKSVTGITNTDYSTIKSYYDENNNEHKYINLPYINDPLVTTKGNLYLGFEFNFNYMYGGPDSSYLIARKNQNNQDTILYKYRYGFSRDIVILENESLDDIGEGIFGPFDMTGAEDRGDSYALMHIDTRFLNTHGFYTLNVITFVPGGLHYGCGDVSEIYFSPATFICDMIDQVTGKHYDSIFNLHDYGSISDLNTPNEINSKVLNAIGISFDADGVEQYENNSFYPQLYEKNDNSIVLQRLQFGRLKNNNIYFTNRFKDIKLKNLTAPQKMNDYKDGWIENLLYKNDKKFLIGVSGNGLFDNWNYGEDDYIYCQYIPVIEGDTVPEPIHKMYTVRLDLNNPDYNTWGTWIDDAKNFTQLADGAGGENEVDTIMDYYPCTLDVNGNELQKVNPNNYTRNINGGSLSGSDRVMVKFKALGYRIKWFDSSHLDISITDEENVPGFTYLTYNSEPLESFYIGAYLGYVSNGKLLSKTGTTPTVNKTIGEFRTLAKANGNGFEQMPFNILVYLQCCSLVKYKGKPSKIGLGYGYVFSGYNTIKAAGAYNTKGLNYHDTTTKESGTGYFVDGIKMFGIEHLYGNRFIFLEGLYLNDNNHLYFSDGNYNDNLNDYEDLGEVPLTSGYIKKPFGINNKIGLVAKDTGASIDTYFAEYSRISGSPSAAIFGSKADNWGSCGILSILLAGYGPIYFDGNIGSRLVYLKTK